MAAHPVKIRGATAGGTARAALILERTDAAFLPALLAELTAPDGLATVENTQQASVYEKSARAGADEKGVLKLFQPVQRTFHLALYEAYCYQASEPRLDPRKVESAALVLRRITTDAQGNRVYEGWFEADKHLRGWLPLTSATETLDPDPARRVARSLGHAELDRQLALRIGRTAQMTERSSPLFVAPPDVCEATKRTLIYGVIPVTSSEVNTAGVTLPSYADSDIAKHIPLYLQTGWNPRIPYAGMIVSAQTLAASGQNVIVQDADSGDFITISQDANMDDFVTFLQQMAIEFDAFGTTDAAQLLLQQLNQVTLWFNAYDPQPLGDWLQQAAEALVFGGQTGGAASVQMPPGWTTPTAAQAQAIQSAIGGAMRTRLTTLTGGEGRFEDTTRQYVIRACLRVRRDDGCPPDLVWSDMSEPFRIAAWYENNQAVPAVKINLPDVTDKNLLKKMKPNVAFTLPENLFNFLQANSPKDALKGNLSGGGSGIGLGWLCSFSLPLITICAFLVLNIFLSLFNIIFFWMAFIKICIPIPKKN